MYKRQPCVLPIGVGVACADVDTAASAARAGEITADGASALPVVIVEPCAPPSEQDQCRAVQRAGPRPPERHARAWHRVHAWGLSRAALALTRAWRCPERAWRFRAIFLGCAWARGGWVQRTVASELILGVRKLRVACRKCSATRRSTSTSARLQIASVTRAPDAMEFETCQE